MLGHEKRVPENVWVRCHGYVFVCGKGFPHFVKEGAIVDAHGWGNACSEAGPVLVYRLVAFDGTHRETNFGVIAFGPFKEGGIDT